MISKDKLTQEYYLNTMSMFLKNSYGMIDREEIYRAVLNNVNDIGKLFIYTLYVSNPNDDEYFATIEYDKDSVDGPMLDLVASFYGVTRSMRIKYSYNSTDYDENITLTNEQLKYYLKIIVAKTNYQGTYKELETLYGNDITYSFTDPDDSALCTIKSTSSRFIDNGTLTNLGKLMLSDNILIESMGIAYTKLLGDIDLATFDNALFDDSRYVFGD